MKVFHMLEEHNKAPDLERITIRHMLSLGSNSNNSSSSIGTIEENIRVRKGLNLLKIRCCSSWGENKRLLNIHEKKFAEIASFQANTTVFHANTNDSLKNLEVQIGQLALTMKNQSKDSFLSDTRKNLRDCVAVDLRSGRELEERRKEKKDTEEEQYAYIGEHFKQHSPKTTKEEEAAKIQLEKNVEKENPGKKEEVKAYEPQVPFP